MALSPPFVSCLMGPEKINGNVCAYSVAGVDFPEEIFKKKVMARQLHLSC